MNSISFPSVPDKIKYTNNYSKGGGGNLPMPPFGNLKNITKEKCAYFKSLHPQEAACLLACVLLVG